MKKKVLIYLASLLLLGACSDNNVITNVDEELNHSNAHRSNVRSIDEVVELANLMETKSRSAKDYDIEVITSNTVTPMSRSGNNDTLLYFVSNAEHPLVISADERCYPYFAILDNATDSLSKLFADSENEDIATRIISQMLPNSEIYQQMLKTPVGIDNDGHGARWDNIIVKTVTPKVKVEWSQSHPFNKYCPAGCPAGCVAIAGAQACTVTRHISSFNGNNLDWEKIVGVKNSIDALMYNNQYVTNSIARFISDLGFAIGMNYSPSGSGAKISNLIKKLFSNSSSITYTKDKKKIESTLSDYASGVVIVGSYRKKETGETVGHCYIIDGFYKYESGMAMMHVNMGNGANYNGYYLENFSTPTFIEDAPISYPYDWEFHCIHAIN